jgi:hypothetical protein
VALDLKRFAALWGIVMTSEQPGEVINARDLLRRELAKVDLGWADIPMALEQRGKLLEVAQTLKGERDQFFEQLERIKRRAPPRIDPWANPGTGTPQQQAEWLTELHSEGIIECNTFEQDFLRSIVSWEGAITAKQSKVFERLLARFVQLTGRQPP